MPPVNPWQGEGVSIIYNTADAWERASLANPHVGKTKGRRDVYPSFMDI